MSYLNEEGLNLLMRKVINNIGDTTKLETDAKSSVVAAINELCNAIFDTEQDINSWQDSNITSGTCNALTVANDGTVITCTSYGIKYSEDNGKTWQYSNTTSGIYHAFTVANYRTVIAGSYYNGIKYSEDNGKTWQDSNITRGDYNTFIIANDGTVIAGTDTGIKYCPVTKIPKWEANNSAIEGN